MALVTSYLNEVGRFLPAEQREDILSELRDGIEDEIAGRANSENRQPTGEDEKVVLQRFGHPLKVAGQYQPLKYLIGPGLYPAFIQTLKIAVVVILCLQVFAALVVGQSVDWQIGPFDLVKMALEVTFWVVAWVMVVFAALEFSGERLNWYENWRPESLGRGNLGTINRSDLVTNLISEGVFLLWWNDVMVLQGWIPVIGEDFHLALTEPWALFYWPANLIFGVSFVLHAIVLIRGIWSRWTIGAEIAACVAVIYMAINLMTAGDLVVIKDTLIPEFHDRLQYTVRGALGVVAVIVAWDLWTAIRILRGGSLTSK